MRLEVPSCLKSAAESVCRFAGTLSASTVMPGTGVVPTTTIWDRSLGTDSSTSARALDPMLMLASAAMTKQVVFVAKIEFCLKLVTSLRPYPFGMDIYRPLTILNYCSAPIMAGSILGSMGRNGYDWNGTRDDGAPLEPNRIQLHDDA